MDFHDRNITVCILNVLVLFSTFLIRFVMPVQTPHHRGAISNPDGRFERHRRDRIDDGWHSGTYGAVTEDTGNGTPQCDGDGESPPLPTVVTTDHARTVITRNSSPDIPFDRSINPYRGCEHGCIYCFARPSHGYLGLSSGIDFETRLFAKPDAPALLDRELRQPGYRCQPIAIGTNTDPYQPVERRLGIMRGILEILAAFHHPVTITTKSALILRDIDILAAMAKNGLVSVTLSITTLDRPLARRLEPRAAVPEKRLETLGALAAASIPAGVSVAPLIPGLTDHEMERILEAATGRGANSASWLLLRLPLEVAPLFDQWLAHHFPDRRDRVLNLLRQCRGGRLNDPRFGQRFSGSGSYHAMLSGRFRIATERLRLGSRPELRTDLFRPPPRQGDQLSLFG